MEIDPKEHGFDLLPAWFTARMMDDVWGFGLLMDNGILIGIQAIEDIVQAADGSLWLNVRLMRKEDDIFPNEHLWTGKFITNFTANEDREMATINASKVVAAFEIWDS